MATTALERKRKQLRLQKEERKLLQDASYPHLKTPFCAYVSKDPNWSSVELNFDLMGMSPPTFNNDSGPASSSDQIDPEVYQGYSGSIGRAEIMIEQLLDAATELAGIVNRYKLSEMDARLKELESEDLADPVRRKAVIDETVRISKLRDYLQKGVRRTLSEWSLKGR